MGANVTDKLSPGLHRIPLTAGRLSLRTISVLELTNWQVQWYIEPFHRLFSLDNLAIQYPHAIVERVPLCMSALFERSNQ